MFKINEFVNIIFMTVSFKQADEYEIKTKPTISVVFPRMKTYGWVDFNHNI